MLSPSPGTGSRQSCRAACLSVPSRKHDDLAWEFRRLPVFNARRLRLTDRGALLYGWPTTYEYRVRTLRTSDIPIVPPSLTGSPVVCLSPSGATRTSSSCVGVKLDSFIRAPRLCRPIKVLSSEEKLLLRWLESFTLMRVVSFAKISKAS